MSKILVVGDNHGSSIPLAIAKEKIADFDKVVFLGDFFDHNDKEYEEQEKNFRKVMKFKQDNLDKVVVLLGNHDSNYILPEMRCWQPDYEDRIRKLILRNLHIIDFIFYDNRWVFTHAGISKVWLSNILTALGIQSAIDSFNIDYVKLFNDMFHGGDFSHLRFAGTSGYGDEITQNPMWIRPDSLKKSAIKEFNQCVGHTAVPDNQRCWKDGNDVILFLDSEWRNIYAEIDTISNLYEIKKYENPYADW